ncbi:MAG: glycoside hydrolase [Bacteroidetes bacterium]|nr:MAG: glycoside hydrolase [Bacteroidota bacterium]
MKYNLFLFMLFFLFSCSTDHKNDAEKIVRKFISANSVDQRETVFEINLSTENGQLIVAGETDRPELKSGLLSELKIYNPIDQISVLPDSTVGEKLFGLINLSVANLRTEPNHAAELATQALFGTPVKILQFKNGWYRIQTPDNYISWVDDDGLFPLNETEFEKWKVSKRVIFTGDNGTIFENHDFGNPVSDVTTGNILLEVSRNPKSIQVQLPDGRTGFTEPENWLDFENFKNTVLPDSATVRLLAVKLTGRPYLWGGTSARAMDCSGFVKTIYFMNGIVLARDASLQVKQGILADTLVNPASFQTGDLLFFGQKASETSKERVTHVALSLGGNEFIHASGRIKVNSFNPESPVFSEYRKSSFIRARRIIGAESSSGVVKLKEHSWY